jgi:hypothetical protein
MQSDVLLMMIREGRSQVTLKKKEQNERQKEKNTKKKQIAVQKSVHKTMMC